MTGERIAALFAAAIELPDSERGAFLRAATDESQEVRDEAARLVAAYARAGDFLEPALDPERALALLDDEAISERKGEDGLLVGPYRLIREVGRGGMGTVYLAERVDGTFEKRVALKLIKRGMDSEAILQRFLRERQILARLEHPHIARLYDGGLTEDGRHYFAMEFVDGRTINQYCAEKKLDVEARLGLFRDVCSAVQYAHANLVIHRDLKASNILVTKNGEVKLLDFGIARVLDDDSEQTQTGQRMLTPIYAAPEQLAGRAITTATDIYGLGLVLYELLAGHGPYRFEMRTPEAVSRVLANTEPERPSSAAGRTAQILGGDDVKSADGAIESITPQMIARERSTTPERLRRRLSGDLDGVVLKALEKEPERRYSSAEALGEDVTRHLEGLPVRAQRSTLRYRSAKFVRRHRVGMAIAMAFAVLLFGSGVTLVLEQARTAAERDKAEAVKRFVLSLFVVSDPTVETRGDLITAGELLERGTQRIDQELHNQPEIQAEMLAVVGNIYMELGRYDQAEPHLKRALASRREVLGSRHPEVAQSLGLLAVLRRRQGDLGTAETLHREALTMRRRLLAREHPEIAQSLNDLGLVLVGTGQHEAAEPFLNEALAMRRKLFGRAHPEVAESVSNLGRLQRLKGDYDAAEALHREALTMRRELLGDEHPSVAISLSDLGGLVRLKGDYQQAVMFFQEALTLQRRLLGDEHPNLATTMNNLAVALMQLAEYDRAEPLVRETLAIRKKLLGNDHPAVAGSLNQLGTLLFLSGDYKEAEPIFRQTLALTQERLGEEHPDVANRLGNLAVVLRKKGDYAGAESLFREALAMQRRLLGNDHPSVATSLSNLGALLSSTGAFDQAETVLREALALRRKRLGDRHPDVTHSLGALGSLLREKGAYAEAESLLREALALNRQHLGDQHPDVGYSLHDLGALLVKKGDYDGAEAILLQAQSLFEESLSEGHSDTALPLVGLARLYLSQRQPTEAERVLREALEIFQEALSDDHWRPAEVQSLLGTALSVQGRADEAELLLLEGHAGLQNSLGKKHARTKMAAEALVAHYQRRGTRTEPLAASSLNSRGAYPSGSGSYLRQNPKLR